MKLKFICLLSAIVLMVFAVGCNNSESVDTNVESTASKDTTDQVVSSMLDEADLLVLGDDLFYGGKYDEALINYQKVLETDPNNEMALMGCCNVYLEKAGLEGNSLEYYNLAVETYEKVKKYNSSIEPPEYLYLAYKAFAEDYVSKNDDRSAYQNYKIAYSLNENNPLLLLMQKDYIWQYSNSVSMNPEKSEYFSFNLDGTGCLYKGICSGESYDFNYSLRNDKLTINCSNGKDYVWEFKSDNGKFYGLDDSTGEYSQIIKNSSAVNIYDSWCEDIDSYYDMYVSTAMSQADINFSLGNYNMFYDNLLNIVYKHLSIVLPNEEFEKLEEEQISWINDKEAAANQQAGQYAGGTAYSMIYGTSSSEITKERTLELIDMLR